MKCVILAGGRGSRLSEETNLRPKPMVEIGGRPIIWHIMKLYSTFGVNDFIICLGYMGYSIKEYFANYFLHESDVTFDFSTNSTEIHQSFAENWRVTLVNTGDTTMTGGRLRRVREFIGDDTFCFTYGDGVGDVDIKELISFHKSAGARATITGVKPPGRFGQMVVDDGIVRKFEEKAEGADGIINGGFFVLEPSVIDLIDSDDTSWEREPLERLSQAGDLACYVHDGFWKPMDTLRDRFELERLWQSGDAPWRVWS